MDCWRDWLHMVAEIGTALGTLLVAVAAIWGDPIRAWLVGPKLSLCLRDSRGERIDLTGGRPARYYHLAVANSRRSAIAHNVRVVLVAVSRPAADGEIASEPLSGPVQLTWQHGHALPQFATIGPPANADLGFVVRADVFTLCPLFKPNNLDITLRGGDRMVVDALAVSDETESPLLRLEIAWDGSWSEDAAQMARHLVIKELPAD